MSTEQQRAVAQVLEDTGRSERMACCLADLHRSSKRYQQTQKPDAPELVARLHAIATRHPGYGSSRAHMTLRFACVPISLKRVE